jgi:hypothetical protein
MQLFKYKTLILFTFITLIGNIFSQCNCANVKASSNPCPAIHYKETYTGK